MGAPCPPARAMAPMNHPCRSRGAERPHGAHGRPRWRPGRLLLQRTTGIQGEPLRRERPAPSWRLAVSQPVSIPGASEHPSSRNDPGAPSRSVLTAACRQGLREPELRLANGVQPVQGSQARGVPATAIPTSRCVCGAGTALILGCAPLGAALLELLWLHPSGAVKWRLGLLCFLFLTHFSVLPLLPVLLLGACSWVCSLQFLLKAPLGAPPWGSSFGFLLGISPWVSSLGFLLEPLPWGSSWGSVPWFQHFRAALTPWAVPSSESPFHTPLDCSRHSQQLRCWSSARCRAASPF